jgi:alanine racemase
MASYSVKDITRIMDGELLGGDPAIIVSNICTDSRKLIFPESSIFFALSTARRNGHQFIKELYDRGVRVFVVSDDIDIRLLSAAAFIKVKNVLSSLQQLAAHHRNNFHYPVIGITGSNGKTIIKEWLYQLLQDQFSIVRSPKSYNSQIGVPLSVWAMNQQHNLAIFEAGISQKAEMQKLAAIIQPTIGIMSNIGDAHEDGFTSMEEKLHEKLLLFSNTGTLIYCKDHSMIDEAVTKGAFRKNKDQQYLSWGYNKKADIIIEELKKGTSGSTIHLSYQQQQFTLSAPFLNDAYLENLMHCIAAAFSLGVDVAMLQKNLLQLKPVSMRLELKQGINNCSLINDTYSADLHSLEIALDFLLQQQQHQKRTVILSDITHSGRSGKELYDAVARLLHEKKVNKLLAVGEQIGQHKNSFEQFSDIQSFFYPSVASLEQELMYLHLKDETILIKGARIFELERIEKLLEQKVHQTVLEINLSAIAHNLKEYQRMLHPGTKIMVMVKAFGYGSGTYEIANLLQFHKCDYLAVAYADEGVELRKAGITMPIMVMNPEETAFDLLSNHNLEPEIFSFPLLKKFDAFCKAEGLQNFPVHIKLDTGMHRLGFMPSEIDQLCLWLKQNRSFKIQSVFSHLAASELAKHDDYTKQQDYLFSRACIQISAAVDHHFLMHIGNSAAIFRHPSMQYDMVRLGIGLYGVDSTATDRINLKEVSTLKTTIAQIKELKKGETVGYGRQGVMQQDGRIAVVRIGYADGYSRRMGNGNGKMLLNGKLLPVIGNVCMDMTMLDITQAGEVNEGDEVIVFGSGLSVEQLAKWSDTIAYEIMTGISQRVKRVYFEE